MWMHEEIKAAVEAVLFLRAERVTIEELVDILDVGLLEIKPVMKELLMEYNQKKRGLQILETEGAYVMCTRPEYAGILARLDRPVRKRLTPAALETLAVIAYQQPVTRAEIEKIRGVRVDKIINNLLEKGLIMEAGQKPVVGKPVLYRTTEEFLRVFGLISLQDLPVIKEE